MDITNDYTGKDITEIFDITNFEHISEWVYLQKNGQWKVDSIFKECKYSNLWQLNLYRKLADGYIHYWTRLN